MIEPCGGPRIQACQFVERAPKCASSMLRALVTITPRIPPPSMAIARFFRSGFMASPGWWQCNANHGNYKVEYLDELEALNRQIIRCRRCPRLVEWREAVASTKRKAYGTEVLGETVPGFGDRRARILVVGLAPGAHGSNRTGRQFTGDASGQFLYSALFRAGIGSSPESTSRDDGLTLDGLYVTASCRCVPPDNRPTPEELANCRPYLAREIDVLKPRVIVCLGHIAFRGVLHCAFAATLGFSIRPSCQVSDTFGRTRRPQVAALLLHPSQQNTLTGRLSVRMFDAIWEDAKELAGYDGR